MLFRIKKNALKKPVFLPKNIRHFVYLFTSTGFGGGIIVNGDVMRGTHGNAGEVGDIIPLPFTSPQPGEFTSYTH
jgi:predicted NBD/HSP70 family sugar kinase